MARHKMEVTWMVVSWLITIVVAVVVFIFNNKRDVIDYLVVVALVLLSGRQSYKFLREHNQGS